MTILRTEELTKEFPGVLALDRVDFQVDRGEIHGLVGENGAGKSTLVKILAGALQPTAGRILISEQEVTPKSPRDMAETIGLVHQERELIPFFTGVQNLFLGHEIAAGGLWLSTAEMKKKATEFLRQYDLDVDLELPAKELSNGQQEMLTILKVLFRDPEIIIFDEPTASLSIKESQALFALIRDLKVRGKTIIYISHILPEVLEIADRITVLRNGKKVKTVSSGEIDEKGLISLMIAKDMEEQYPKVMTEKGEELLSVRNYSVGSLNLKDINLSIRSGEIVGFAGLVGSGRTELAKALFTGVKPDGGEVYLKKKRYTARSARDAIRQGIVMIPEKRREEGLIAAFDVQENLILPSLSDLASYGLLRPTAVNSHVRSVIKNLSIKVSFPEQRVSTLSGGNQQKVSLGKWFGQKAVIWIFDEPTQGIDVETKSEIYSIMGEIARGGAGVWFISSDLRELTAISDRIYVMRNSKIVGEFQPPFDKETILSRMLGKEEKL